MLRRRAAHFRWTMPSVAAMATQIQGRPFRRPSEVAKTIVFPAPDEASYIVGSMLVIDGSMGSR